MSVIGTVKNGVIQLPPGTQLEEGQQVEIVPAPLQSEAEFVLRETAAAAPPVSGLPDDLASNLDYYLHGHDHKQQPRRGRWIPTTRATPELTGSQAEEFANKLLALAAQTSNLPPDLATDRRFEQAGFTALLK